MTSDQIRSSFLEFFKKRGHSIIPSASLVPENDPTVLFNTAGMQPLVPYLMGEKHPAGDKIADVQKCVRTTDIDDIGDNTHATFFEMLGNWSLGSYFKKEAITWSYEFLTSKKEGLGLDPKRLYVTVFEGDNNVSKDIESFDIWKSVGLPEDRIYFKGADTNWWPAVKGKDTWTGPTGPCSEMFYDITEGGLGDLSFDEYDKADEDQKVVEIWNNVFMEYEKKNGQIVGKLKQKNVDTGAGLERIAAVVEKKDNIFDTDCFEGVLNQVKLIVSDKKSQRIVADHFRTATFLIGDGVLPSNTDRGYILRRILRRAIFHTDKKSILPTDISNLVDAVVGKYGKVYPELIDKAPSIKEVTRDEAEKFGKTITQGIKELNKISHLTGEKAFDIYQSYGLPLEMAEEIKPVENREDFFRLIKKHQELSRNASGGMFKGGLADAGEETKRLHTATHLLNAALRQVLGEHIMQKGSNITPERLRFDFSHDQKMTGEEKKKTEDLVNGWIADKLPVTVAELPKSEAEKVALHSLNEKYGDMVKVYSMGAPGNYISREFCGGPHVNNTGDLASISDRSSLHFKIIKEEAVSAGVRRIKAVLG